MKKFSSVTFILLLTSIFFSGCKSENKKKEKKLIEKKEVIAENTATFVLKNATNAINFTAYKTTEKIPVKGVFTKVEITNDCKGNTIKDAINGAEFKIPISSIETKDTSRNFKIKKFFFQVMENTMALTGKLTLNDDKNGVAEFTMNGITEKLPFEYSINDTTFSMKTTMDVDKWSAKKAIASLNEVCKDLHKGKDGISKTWSEVSINVTSVFK